MRNIEEKLKFFVDYYNATRQVGHTMAVLNGAIISGAIVVAINEQEVKSIIDKSCNQVDCISQHYLEDLLGIKSPILFDNSVLHSLFSEALSEIKRLKSITRTGSETSYSQTEWYLSVGE